MSAGIIAFQGVPGAYSDLACRGVRPDMKTLPCASFEDTFAAVRDRQAAFARGEGTPQGAGIGLRLIRERLAALYGGAAILETGRSAPGGFRASVTLPYTGPSGSPA